MRRLVILCAVLLTVAGPAGAQQKKARIVAPAPSRPATAAAPAATPDPRAPIGPITPPASTPVGGQAQQCRLACAQTYYFCLSDSQAQDCSGNWGQCRVGCSAGGRAGY